jgi:CubicO group peptidase (beta-lactamase class C family)
VCKLCSGSIFTGNVIQKIESGYYHPNDRNPKTPKDGTKQKFTADTVCWIASCTKLMTTVSVMQCVEKGILNLDDDVGQTWLPELKDPEILLRMEEDADGNVRRVVKKATRKVTLRFV